MNDIDHSRALIYKYESTKVNINQQQSKRPLIIRKAEKAPIFTTF